MSWKDDLPEPLRDAPFISKAESLEDAVGKITHAANHMGASIRLPDKDASDEQMEDFLSRIMEKVPSLTRKPSDDDLPPTDIEGYTLPEEIPWDGYDEARKEAMEAGLTRKQFVALYGTKAQHEAEIIQAMQEEHKEGLERLQREWGETYNDRVADLKQFAIDTDAPEEIVDALQSDSLGADSLRWLYKWVAATEETASNTGRDYTPTSKLSPAEIEIKINEIQGNPAYWDAASPQHESLKARMVELVQRTL